MNTIDFHWLDSDLALAEACDQWQQQDVLFVDTEFVRRTTYYPQLGLIQVSDGDTHWLVDPKAIGQWQPFIEVLSASHILKVMHSASEDIDVFWAMFKTAPKPLFDTQIAAALAGVGSGWGFAKMVEHFTGEQLDKAETTSDWLARPLTEKQCQYAVADVALLAPCYRGLSQALSKQERLTWVLEDSLHQINSHVCFMPDNTMYLRVKGIGKLTGAKLAIAQDLAAWREQQCKVLDRPRSRVLKDADLLAIAKQRPSHSQQIPRSDAIGDGWLRRFGEPVIEVVSTSLAREHGSWPSAIKEPNAAEKAQLQRMRERLASVAETLNIDSQALAAKKDLRALNVACNEGQDLPPLFKGWRHAYVATLLADQQAEL